MDQFRDILRNLPRWVSEHSNQLLIAARLCSVAFIGILVAAQAWAPTAGMAVVSAYLHLVLRLDG